MAKRVEEDVRESCIIETMGKKGYVETTYSVKCLGRIEQDRDVE